MKKAPYLALRKSELANSSQCRVAILQQVRGLKEFFFFVAAARHRPCTFSLSSRCLRDCLLLQIPNEAKLLQPQPAAPTLLLLLKGPIHIFSFMLLLLLALQQDPQIELKELQQFRSSSQSSDRPQSYLQWSRSWTEVL